MTIDVVILWLRNENGELLLARRADHKSEDPSFWGPSLTGKVENGETFEQALQREAIEELSLKPELYEPHFLFEINYNHPDDTTRHFKVFFANIPKTLSSKLKLDKDEVAEIKWQTVEQLQELLKTKPGEKLVHSAFILWEKVFKAIEESAYS